MIVEQLLKGISTFKLVRYMYKEKKEVELREADDLKSRALKSIGGSTVGYRMTPLQTLCPHIFGPAPAQLRPGL